MKKLNNQYIFIILFWTLYFLYEWLSVPSMSGEYRRYFISACVMVPTTFIAAILTVHVYFAKFYLKSRKRLFWIASMLTMFVLLMIRRLFYYYHTYPLYYPEGMLLPFFYVPKLIIDFVNMYLIVGLYSLIYFFRSYYEQQKLNATLQKEMIRSELELLKLQVHPHFIFNTLNNIYSFSIQQKPKAADLIHRLSSFLDYNLYQAKENTVPLINEIEYIQHYIELEKIRFGDRLDISINILSEIEHFYISPMLLLPLVENAFKHGAGKLQKDAWIRMDISMKRDILTVKIENNYAEQTTQSERPGIGLDNVKRRLEILYEGAHEISIMKESGTFLVVLKIKNGITA
ncbi:MULTISPECIES: sensor histidine kinase [Olivibacter]|uniref:Sensor histidine kinase n=2 Tax=Olivibacter TaxID=376469 RepID=A0ABV6HLF0_9SPHI|nr:MULTISPECIES: histidine kinase [Olivibacter]MCL4639522.1 histidine kinase [Olivibacter sp. UJ_SKK_5.1]MDM8175776.1 histidine kinase [Olivibacter sp. 47]MDX3914384.1 histidine kinase [Pseudosphingobacterium sp.]QEL02507.1 histidine kinase [Olivibacter sp. LS-1]